MSKSNCFVQQALEPSVPSLRAGPSWWLALEQLVPPQVTFISFGGEYPNDTFRYAGTVDSIGSLRWGYTSRWLVRCCDVCGNDRSPGNNSSSYSRYSRRRWSGVEFPASEEVVIQ